MIANTFIKRPVTAIVISIVILIVGVLAILNLPVGQYPDITPPVVQVRGTYIGADAQTVEQTVATPIESQVNGTPGMSYLKSNSTSDGQMSMDVTFEVGTNVDIAALDVQNRVSVATPQLPMEVQRQGLIVKKRNPSTLMVVALYSPEGSHDIKFLDNYTNIYVKDALSRVKGVGDVTALGKDFSMRLWLKPDKLARLGLTATDVITAIQEQNVQVAAGAVGRSPQPENQSFEYTVLVNGRLKNVAEFEDIIIKTLPEDGSMVYLKDVGRVELGKFNYSGASFVDGKEATFLLINQAPGSNALETAEGVYEMLAQLQKSFPPDVDFKVPFESVSVVKISINEVLKTLVEALILVILVVFLFLQSWRATLIPILAIPVSIIGTFIFFIPLDFTINTLTLFGFVLTIGIVVDDAIVVVEAVQHYLDTGKYTAKEATIKAMKDISGPVIAIALILAAVFVPVGFIPGIVGRLYQQFAITIAISVLISAFVALTLTPALCAMFLKPMNINKDSKGLNRFFYKFNTWFDKTSQSYSNGVKKSIHYSRYMVVLLVCIIFGTMVMFKNKPTGFIPLEDEGRLYVTFELPEASSIARTQEVMNDVMKAFQEVEEVKHFAAIVGLNVVTFSNKPNSGTIFCTLKSWDERKRKDQQLFGVIAKLNQKFATIKEANIIVIPPPAIPGLGNTGGFSFILQQRESNDGIKGFERVAMQFMMEANKRPEIARAFTFFTARTPGYNLKIDREKAKKLGVSLSEVFNTVQTFLGSRYINDFTVYGRNFKVMAQADTTYRDNMSALEQYYVRNQKGEMLPLSTLIDYEVTESAPVISHYNLYRSAEFNGSATPGFSSGEAIQALKEVAAEVLPAGYGYEFSGLSKEEISSGDSTVYIFALSVLFVFLFLAALYESWSVPFAVLLAVPVGAFGAITALSLSPGLTNNIYAQIGLVTLIGLAAKNAILIVEFAKERVDHGMELISATLQAVRLRLRPIIMTSLAFILGVVPLALSSGAGAVARNTIGWTVFGGMLAATLIAIFIVPVLYVLITKMAYGKEGLEKLRASHKAEEYMTDHV
ncbi:multidrug efflux RND transporter permease subunit [Rapidithrix thailandica]|uniref:Multidrug efflux RND transporter permease subunit n=1 Tax=Rapidithrix thailandica TaxID=413964 RepID=A0AAW9S975_9BACT